MALDFPASPTNGQVYGSYVYNSTVGAWQSKEDPATIATVSTTAPASANPGDLWYDSDDGTSYMYYDDGTSAQWVELLSSGVPLLNTKANLAGGNALTGVQSITSTATTQTPLIVNGIASQTANLQEWKNSAGVTQASVAYDGKMNIGSSLTFADPGVGVETRFTFNRATDGAWLSVLERAADRTVYEFGMSDNPDANDYFQWKFIDWQNPSSGWMPLQIGGFVNRIIGLNSQFWGNIQTVSNTPFFTTNNGTGGTDEKIGYYAPQTSTTYNLNKDSGTGTGTLNVDVSGYNVNSVTTFRVVIDSGATTFSWGYGSSTTQGTGITITGGWQVLAGGVSVKLSTTGNIAGDRWAFRAFPVSKFALGGTPLTTSMSTIYPKAGMNGLVIRGDSGQTADLQQWQNSGGTSLSSINSNGALITPAITDLSYRKIVNPDGAMYTTTSNSHTGAIRITLPVGWTSHMHKFSVSVFDYNSLKSFDVSIAGYNYTGGTWVNPTAYIIGNQDVSVNYTVRFGYTAGGKACVYIGETGSTWNYPQIAVNNVLVGFGTSSTTWLSGWSVDFVTAFESVSQTVTNTQISAGLVPITPTSVSVNSGSASVAANGTINFSGGVTNLRVNGCFSSAYKYYRVMFEVEATSSGMDLMFQLINLGSGYTYGRIGTYSGPTFTQSFTSGSAAAMMSRSNQGNGSGGWMDVINPAHAATKRFLSQSVDSGFLLWLGSINGSLSTFSDFQIYSLQGGTLTNGSLKVYGYR